METRGAGANFRVVNIEKKIVITKLTYAPFIDDAPGSESKTGD